MWKISMLLWMVVSLAHIRCSWLWGWFRIARTYVKICETFDSGNTALWARPSGCAENEATVFGYGSPFYLVNYSMTKTLSRDFPEMQIIQLSIESGTVADNQSPHLLSLTNESFFLQQTNFRSGIGRLQTVRIRFFWDFSSTFWGPPEFWAEFRLYRFRWLVSLHLFDLRDFEFAYRSRTFICPAALGTFCLFRNFLGVKSTEITFLGCGNVILLPKYLRNCSLDFHTGHFSI